MDANRQKLIDRAKQLNTESFDVMELQQRIREVCSEYLIEAKVNVARLLDHEDWRVRWSALDIVWWGLGETDGIEESVHLLMHDPDEDIRAQAALALYEACRGTAKQSRVVEALKAAAADPANNDYVRATANRYISKLAD